MSERLAALTARLGTASTEFECCDTAFRLEVRGPAASRALDRAASTARRLEAQLDAFDDSSAVACLNETGCVENEHVARVVRRALAYRERTDGVFDVQRGRLEHDLKRYLRGDVDEPPSPDDDADAAVTVNGDTVETSAPLDLNGLAKGYIVDRVHDAAAGLGRTVFVSGGGDMTPPPAPVGVESPWDDTHLRALDTDWAVATSGGYRRERGGLDHIYDPRAGTVGSRHDLVTVVAERDCTEADALATTLAVLPHEAALSLAEDWQGVEALVVTCGVFRETEGFGDHVVAT
ncbi:MULTISPECIES: FAD:protein FMN transferase [Salinibaculum]|uniref:FAD:protein FMN transferase n=1 Tax=Salinibaculum TaxID=2732368 RepID=UPI0030D576FA